MVVHNYSDNKAISAPSWAWAWAWAWAELGKNSEQGTYDGLAKNMMFISDIVPLSRNPTFNSPIY